MKKLYETKYEDITIVADSLEQAKRILKKHNNKKKDPQSRIPLSSLYFAGANHSESGMPDMNGLYPRH